MFVYGRWMGFNNPPVPWSEIERRLSDRPPAGRGIDMWAGDGGDHGPTVARRELDRLITDFGRDNVVVELWDHGHPLDSVRNDGLAELAVATGVDVVATANAHHHSVSRHRLA